MVSSATWALVVTTIEPPEVVLPFVMHHLDLGATQVFVYLDRPDPSLFDMLSGIDRVEVIQCDDAHWATLKPRGRPKAVEYRQILNAQQAHAKTQADWIAHVDTDEFLRCSRPLGAELAHVPDVFSLLKLEVRERAFLASDPEPTIYSGVVRVPFVGRTKNGLALMGPPYHMTDGGLTGHVAGKYFVRSARRDLLMGIHKPRPKKSSDPDTKRPRHLISSSTTLLHYDGMTRRQWVGKMIRYLSASRSTATHQMADSRVRLLDRVESLRNDPDGLADLHASLKTVSRDDEGRFFALGLIEEAGIDPIASVKAAGLGDGLKFSTDAYDRAYVADPFATDAGAVRAG